MASLLQAVRNAGANKVVILGAWRTRRLLAVGGLGEQIPTLASRLNGLSIANVAASSHSYDLNACCSQS